MNRTVAASDLAGDRFVVCDVALFYAEHGLFWDLAGREHTALKVSTWSSLAPLALPSLPESIARRLIEEHLLHPRRYRAPYGIPSVSMRETDAPSVTDVAPYLGSLRSEVCSMGAEAAGELRRGLSDRVGRVGRRFGTGG